MWKWFVIIFLASADSHSAEITVLPGEFTLRNAIGVAQSGDTLLLQSGTYTETEVKIFKSLTIRALNREAVPVIRLATFVQNTSVVGGRIWVNPNDANISVTFQGITFQGIGSRKAFTKCGANSSSIGMGLVSFLQSTFIGQFSNLGCKAAKLIIVGNNLIGTETSAGLKITAERSGEVYVAANKINRGTISVSSGTGEAWVLGNYIQSLAASSGAIIAQNVTNYVLGNRVFSPAEVVSANIWFGIICRDCTVASNIIAPGGPAQEGLSYAGITTGTGASFIYNNVYQRPTGGADALSFDIRHQGVGRIYNNIVLGGSGDSVFEAGSEVDVRNNICFGGQATCDESAGNLNIDPIVVNGDTLTLAPNSPAIDAGVDEFYLADTDRSLNDIGAHGGPWNIQQYDEQRNTSTLAPFVFPLIDVSSSITGSSLKVRALGVAKLK